MKRAVFTLLAAALVLAGLPGDAYAATPIKQLLSRPPPLRTVDHPAVDGVTAFDNGRREGNLVALTFDADMTPGMVQQLRGGAVRSWYNREVIDILRSEHARATLFLTGLWAATYPDDARDLARDPLFEIGNHTYDHGAFRTPCYALWAAPDRRAEIADAQTTIATTAGVTPRYLRFPGDCYDRSDVALAGSLGLTVISGDVRGGDGFNNSPGNIAATVLGHLQPGSIVVMHMHGGPNAPMTAPALRSIIAGARQRGLGFGSVSDVLGRTPPPTTAEIIDSLRHRDLIKPLSLADLPGRRAPLLNPRKGPRSVPNLIPRVRQDLT